MGGMSKAKASKKRLVSPRDLGNWKLLEDFRDELKSVYGTSVGSGSWEDPKRRLEMGDYLSLFLFALFNPAVRTVRAISQASELERVQQEVCSRRVSRSSFSEAQHIMEPEFLERVFGQLSGRIGRGAKAEGAAAKFQWLARDSSLFRALPRMSWALYGGGRAGAPNRAVRLHLDLHIWEDKPVGAQVREGRVCERVVWEESLTAGSAYIGDRYYGESYQLLDRLDAKDCRYVVRLRDTAVINVEQELALSKADRAAGVSRQALVRLGARPSSAQKLVRVVWVEKPGLSLRLVTNVPAEQLEACEVAELYHKRWRIELFFRWVKCILGARHWLAESQRGVTIQLYLALIASLLLTLYSGRRPNKRFMELLQLYMMGWASLAELRSALARLEAQAQKRKKS